MRLIEMVAALLILGGAQGTATHTEAPKIELLVIKESAMTDDRWNSVPAFNNFADVSDGKPSLSHTSCQFAHSESAFFARCVVQQPKSKRHIPKSTADIQSNDYVALALSLNDSVQSPIQYVFFLAPNGLHAATSTLTQDVTAPWDASVAADPKTDESYWIATFSIPFSSMHVPPPSSQLWRVGVFRSDISEQMGSYWPFVQGAAPLSAKAEATITNLSVIEHP
jgi:hypothetical protein